MRGDAGADFILGQENDDVIEGGDGNDQVAGDQGVDKVSGGAGGDEIEGNDGNDLLTGDGGADTMNAGPDIDQCAGGAGNDFCHGSSPAPPTGKDPDVCLKDVEKKKSCSGYVPKFNVMVDYVHDRPAAADDEYVLTGKLDQTDPDNEDVVTGTSTFAGSVADFSHSGDSCDDFSSSTSYNGTANLTGSVGSDGSFYFIHADMDSGGEGTNRNPADFRTGAGDFTHPVPPEGDTWTNVHEGRPESCDGVTTVTYTLTPIT